MSSKFRFVDSLTRHINCFSPLNQFSFIEIEKIRFICIHIIVVWLIMPEFENLAVFVGNGLASDSRLANERNDLRCCQPQAEIIQFMSCRASNSQ